MSEKQMAMVLLACTAATGALGCGDDPAGKGTLAVEIWGEEFIEQGIPAGEFADGWTVHFDRMLVAVDALTVAQGSEAPAIDEPGQRLFDLTRPGPFGFLTREVAAGRYDNIGYRIAPTGADAQAASCSADDLQLMRDGDLSIYAAGSASKDGQTKTFRWGFARTTTYHGCHSAADLADGDAAVVQLTIHADHLFYDDLFREDPAVTFARIAEADADGDGEVTPAELKAFDITALPNYGTGSTGIDNLWDFVEALTGTVGHIDGEGHCAAR